MSQQAVLDPPPTALSAVGAAAIREKRACHSSQLLGLNALHQGSTLQQSHGPQEQEEAAHGRSPRNTVKPALKTSSIPWSVLQFFN